MHIPEVINAKVECHDTSDLKDIIIELKVTAGRKNPYHILFPKTNANGFTSLTRDDFIGQFKDHWEMGLMDYNGTIETANSLVDVSLFNPKPLIENKELAIAWSLLTHEKTKWESKGEQYQYWISCRNLEFNYDPIKVDLAEQDSFSLSILKK